jgi:hypothetical protein
MSSKESVPVVRPASTSAASSGRTTRISRIVSADMPQPEAGPARIVVRPPAHSGPAAVAEEAARPVPCTGVSRLTMSEGCKPKRPRWAGRPDCKRPRSRRGGNARGRWSCRTERGFLPGRPTSIPGELLNRNGDVRRGNGGRLR